MIKIDLKLTHLDIELKSREIDQKRHFGMRLREHLHISILRRWVRCHSIFALPEFDCLIPQGLIQHGCGTKNKCSINTF